MAFKLDLPVYLARVGLGMAAVAPPSRAALAKLMLAQSRSIAFENLTVVLGGAVSIEPADIEQKLVRAGRGGYCFEHNNLLLAALRELGYDAVPLLCKVRWAKAPDQDTTFTHVALKVVAEGAPYLVDVGFAGTNSVEPIRLDRPGEPQALIDGRYRTRLLAHRDVLAEPALTAGYTAASWEVADGDWRDLYMFDADAPATFIDQELANWWSCTHPTSRFMSSFFVARVVGEVRHHILNADYVVRGLAPGSEAATTAIATKAQLLELLTGVFGLELPENTHGLDRYLAPASL